jgi:hypothetical protein
MNGVANGLYGGDLPNKINTPWIDFSEQSSIIGWTTFTVKSIFYRVIGKFVIVNFNISGTSNSTSTSFTLPFVSGSPTTVLNTCIGVDTGTSNICDASIATQASTLVFNRWSAATTRTATWTASGTKTITGQIIIQIS